jgi:hypothetical protein
MSKFNGNGWNAVACNGPLQNYDTYVRNATPAERAAFFMNPRNNIDTTSLYPWSRDIVATSGWATSAKDNCTSPKGVPTEGITRLGVYLYKSPINGLPPFNDVKCADCRTNGGSACLNCGAFEPSKDCDDC